MPPTSKPGPAARIPFGKQLRSFTPVFWIANWMELVERFAYYGVRVMLPVFMIASFADGAPLLTHLQKGEIFAFWAVVQSFVPIFSGGFADRYGYKVNIAVATFLKILGYLVMGFCVPIAESLAGQPLLDARAAGTDLTYEVFFLGAMLLALGTAIFKPGIQGLIAAVMPAGVAATGWSVFYQFVNIGGFVGPIVAGYLRVLDYQQVFVVCSVGIALNFIPLFLFREPTRAIPNTKRPITLLKEAITGLLEARLFFFTMAFSGFWLMFYQLFDILPNFIDDWVDSRAAAAFLASIFGADAVPTVHGGNLTQEWIINFNALLISIFAFSVGYVTGRMRSLTAIVAGILISAIAIFALGMSMGGWWCLAAIALFSLGEMLASPTKMRYLASIAPPGRDGQYMGYSNMTVGIGWSIGSVAAGHLYESGGDKANLAIRHLVDHAGYTAEAFTNMPKDEVLSLFERTFGLDAWATRDLLWETYEPGSMWLIFMLIGVFSMLALVVYSYFIRRANRDASHPINQRGIVFVRIALVPIVGALVVTAITAFSPALMVMTVLFGGLLVAAFLEPIRVTEIDADNDNPDSA